MWRRETEGATGSKSPRRGSDHPEERGSESARAAVAAGIRDIVNFPAFSQQLCGSQHSQANAPFFEGRASLDRKQALDGPGARPLTATELLDPPVVGGVGLKQGGDARRARIGRP